MEAVFPSSAVCPNPVLAEIVDLRKEHYVKANQLDELIQKIEEMKNSPFGNVRPLYTQFRVADSDLEQLYSRLKTKIVSYLEAGGDLKGNIDKLSAVLYQKPEERAQDPVFISAVCKVLQHEISSKV